MRRVSVRELKDRLEETLAEVEAGETIEFMRDGKPVARLVPGVAGAAASRNPAEILASPAYRRMQATLDRGLSPGGFAADRPRDRCALYDEMMNERSR